MQISRSLVHIQDDQIMELNMKIIQNHSQMDKDLFLKQVKIL